MKEVDHVRWSQNRCTSRRRGGVSRRRRCRSCGGAASARPSGGRRNPRGGEHPAAGARREARRDLPEHRPARAGEGRRARVPRRRPDPASGNGLLSAGEEELQDVRRPDTRDVHAAEAHSRERRPARSHDHGGERLLVRVPEPGFSGRARPARHHDAEPARARPRDAADARFVRAARRGPPHRQGADVLHRRRGHQPVRAGRSRACRRSWTSTTGR